MHRHADVVNCTYFIFTPANYQFFFIDMDNFATARRGKKEGQRKAGLNIEQTIVFNKYMYNLNLCIDNISLPRSITNRNKMLPTQILCTTI